MNLKPATPLPWQDHSGQGQGRIGTNYGRYEVPHPKDAAYIAHCANAYPKLVEALAAMRDTFMTGDECRERAITLLRELREEE